MTTGFHSAPRGGVRLRVNAHEAGLLRSMAALVLQLVEEPESQDEFATLVGIGASTVTPEDPVLARLFPDGYTDDDGAAGDFRRYTEDDLRRHKRENARMVFEAIPAEGGAITLDMADAHAWLKLLNDVRLALGTRLGIKDESDVAILRERLRGKDDQLAAAAHIYDWLTNLQETLVEALMGG